MYKKVVWKPMGRKVNSVYSTSPPIPQNYTRKYAFSRTQLLNKIE